VAGIVRAYTILNAAGNEAARFALDFCFNSFSGREQMETSRGARVDLTSNRF
jgi:hypothetical protein